MAELLLNLLGLAVLVAVTFAAYRLRATDAFGTLTAFAMGIIIAFTAGWLWVAYLVLFLLVGTLATRYRYGYKAKLHAAQEKGGARGFLNVIANGAPATVLAVLYWVFRSQLVTVVFVASVASPLADTLATEIGLLSGRSPRLITNLSESAEPGRSGGVTRLGTFAEVLGSLSFSFLAFLMGIIGLLYVIPATVGGFVGANVDSLLGATVQGYFLCGVCGAHTERSLHCGRRASRVKGLSWLGNNGVNLLSSFAAVLAALLLQLALS
jgi:uncharacterized protein (TIGR00297 family)